jgi:hypothetical protein
MKDLFPTGDGKAAHNPKPRIVKVYDYHGADGTLVFQVCRLEPKSFRQRRPDTEHPGQFVWNMDGVERVLYHLPEVLEAKSRGEPVFLTEGEKDCDALRGFGFIATTNAGGAGKWSDAYTATLTGCHVVILPDRDTPGRKHGEFVAESLHGKAASVKVVELPDRNGSKVKDAADWIAAGGDVRELVALAKAAKEWAPPPPEASTVTVSADGDDTIQARLFRIQNDRNIPNKNQAMAQAVVSELKKRGQLYYHAEHKTFEHAYFFDGERKLLVRLRSDEFTAWLSALLGVNRSERFFNFATAEIETEALAGETQGLIPSAFWASTPNAIYLSCGDGQMAKITAEGVSYQDNGSDNILFASGRTLAPWKLTEPEDPFKACRLFRELSCTAPHGGMLLKLWTTCLPTGQRTKPILVTSGPIGSGKTRVAVGIFELFGMPPRIAKATDSSEGDFWTGLDAGGMLVLDNADTRIDWLPDALAAASTDGLREKRALYTNGDIVRQKSNAWCLATSANPTFASDSGLADRLQVVRLDRRTTETAESALSEEIQRQRDSGLSWICQTLSSAMGCHDQAPAGLNRRHPDYATWAVRIGAAMGCQPEAIQALRAAEQDKSAFNLENDELAVVLTGMLHKATKFSGTASELSAALRVAEPSFDWNPRRVSKRLDRLWPSLEAVFSAKKERGHGGFTNYHFTLNGDYGDYQSLFS